MNKLLYGEIEGVINFQDSLFKFSFLNEKTAKSNDGELYHLFSSVYAHNVLSITGVNSSGKTTSAKLIQWMINLVGTGTIEPFYYYGYSFGDLFKNNVKITLVCFSQDTNMVFNYKLNLSNFNNKFEIIDDYILFKKVTSNMTKKSVYDFNDSHKITREDVSKITQKNTENPFIKTDFKLRNTETMIRYTSFYKYIDSDYIGNERYYRSFRYNEISTNLIKYLDSSVEYLRKFDVSENTTDSTYELKFKNRDSSKVERVNLEDKLSTGTVRWINLFMNAITILKTGGYLIIDEIEMSLHKSLAIDFIRLFNSRITNPLGATLIFTTHYTEILDAIDRVDSIYITSKNGDGQSKITNYSKLISRNDLIKSTMYLKNFTKEQTAPSALMFNKLIEEIIIQLGEKK